MRKAILLALTLALLLSAISVAAESGDLMTVTIAAGSFNQAAARSMLTMVNALRTGNDAWYWNGDNSGKIWPSNLKALSYDYGLEQVAMRRAAELAIRYSHTRPSNQSCFTAYPYELYGYIGENIAYGYSSAQSVFTAWAEEDEPYDGQGHRRNMLSADFTAIGIGCYSYNGTLYWAQEFSSYTSGTADSPLTIPLEVDVSKDLIPTTISIGGSLKLDVGKSASLSDFLVTVGGAPCRIPGITWTSSNSAVAAIRNGSVAGVAKGKTTLTGTCQGLSFTVDVTVRDVAYFPVQFDGSMILNSASSADNLIVDIPEVSGAADYRMELNLLDYGSWVGYGFSGPWRYALCIDSEDDLRPLHCIATVEALDSSGEVIAECVRNLILHPASGVLTLPQKTTSIGQEAFAGASAYCAIVPNGCKSIGSKAFYNCGNLCSVCIPASVTSIASDAFSGCDPDLIISAPAGSVAAQFAQSHGFDYFELN